MAGRRQMVHPVKLDDPTTHKHVESIRRAVDDIQRAPILEAKELGPIELTNGVIVKIRHGLGRALKRWERTALIVDDSVTDAGTIVQISKDAAGNVPDDKKELWLKALGFGGADPTIKLRVY